MGLSMAEHLLKAGHELRVYTRTRAKAERLLEKGAVWVENPAQAACPFTFAMVGYPRDVEEVFLGADGLVAAAPEGAVLVDLTTSQPSLAQRIAEDASKRGVQALDAPVSGGDVGAREGTLAIMVGGEKSAFEATLPLFELMGKTISYLGPAGSGQHTKMCNQILIATTMVGVVESLLYAVESGLEPDQVIDVIGKGAAASWSINNLGRRIVAGDFEPGFFIKHFLKDMGIALAEAERMNLALPGLALAKQLYQAASGLGWEELGTQALYRVLRQMNRP